MVRLKSAYAGAPAVLQQQGEVLVRPVDIGKQRLVCSDIEAPTSIPGRRAIDHSSERERERRASCVGAIEAVV
jgi:hypothetical protein